MPHLNHIVQAARRSCEGLNVRYLDGELYRDSWTLDKIQGLSRSYRGLNPDIEYLQAYIFDIACRKKQSERLELLNRVISNDIIKIVPTERIHPKAIDKYFKSYIRSSPNAEGIVIRTDRPYEQGRSTAVTKLKP